MPLAPGSRIGSLVVGSLIGEGGMGEVYRAHDTTLERDVAIKRLPDSLAGDPERLGRFQREAKALAALNHPNVAQIYAVESGTIVMELVHGETLRGPLPLETVMAYAAQIASALDAAHEKGVVHRDLKPGNVMVTPEGVIKVLDFGLAGRDGSALEQDPTRSPTMTATITGVIAGTAAYMAPEQATGKAVDKRADIWAFGVLLWELLTGRQMFEGETVSHVLAAVLTRAPDISAVPAPVRLLLSRCLEKDPRKRLRDIGDAMSLVQTAEPVASRAKGARGILGWVAAAGIALASVAILWLRPAPPTVSDAAVVRFSIPRTSDIYGQTSSAFALSPDGLRLAYYDVVSGGTRAVVVRTLATGDTRELPNTAVSNPRESLFWSHDGGQLVFGGATRTVVLDATSGVTRTLCECRFTGGTWNPDGVVLLGATRNTPEGIRRMSAGQGAPVEVTHVDASKGERDAFPVFLPDGRRFLFTRTTGDGEAATYLATLDGGEPKRIADGSARGIVSIAGGSSYTVFVEPAGVVARPIDLDSLATTGPGVTLAAGAISVSVSPTGVLATADASSRLRTIATWFDRKGAPVGETGEAGFIDSIALSADGRKLIVSGGNSGKIGESDLWARDLATGANTRITFNPGNDSTPVLSPNGSRVVYASLRGGAALPYSRATDGTGDEAPFFPYEHDAYPNDWSHDEHWVIYSMRKTGSAADNDLWVVPVDGGRAGKPVPYLIAPARQQQAQFSPDGRFVAYGSDFAGTFEIYVQPFPDPSQGKWMVSNGGGTEPRWSRDGKELFYFSGQKLMTVPVSLKPTFSYGPARALFEAPIPPGYTNDSHRWQVGADAKRFVLLPSAKEQQSAPLDVIVNWPALLKK